MGIFERNREFLGEERCFWKKLNIFDRERGFLGGDGYLGERREFLGEERCFWKEPYIFEKGRNSWEKMDFWGGTDIPDKG